MNRAFKEYMAIQYMAGPIKKGLGLWLWPVTLSEPFLCRPQLCISGGFQCVSWQEGTKGQGMEKLHNI